MRYLVIDPDGFVVNIIMWDGVSKFNWRDKTPMLESDAPFGVRIGWRYLNNEWIQPPKPITEENTGTEV